MEVADLPVGVIEIADGVPGFGAAGDDADELVVVFGEDVVGALVELDVGDAELCGADGTGDEGAEEDGGDEDGGDLEAFGTLHDIGEGGVGEDGGGGDEGPAEFRLPDAEHDGDGGRGDRDEDAGGVCAALGVDVCMEEEGDEGCDAHEDEHERPGCARPLRRHTKFRQVARDEVEQACHGGCAGEAEDEDGADVVRRAEDVAGVVMGEPGHGAAIGVAAFCEGLCRDEDSGDDAGEDEEDAHDGGCGDEQAAGVADAVFQRICLDERHDGDAGFEAGETEGELGEEQKGDGEHSPWGFGVGLRWRSASRAGPRGGG